jgi:hypothetical protein
MNPEHGRWCLFVSVHELLYLSNSFGDESRVFVELGLFKILTLSVYRPETRTVGLV